MFLVLVVLALGACEAGLGHILAAVIGLAPAVGVLVPRDLVRRRVASQLQVPEPVTA